MARSAKRTSTHRSPARFIARTLPGAKTVEFPGFIKPQLATLRDSVPSREGWLHEIKFDGYRIQGHLIEGRPALLTRNGHDWTHRMPALAEALARIPSNHLIVDGEIIIPDSRGRSDHDALKEALGAGRQSHRYVFYLFDLMHLDGFDLRDAPLIDRKRVLAELIRDVEDVAEILAAHFCSELDFPEGAAYYEELCAAAKAIREFVVARGEVRGSQPRN